MIAQCTSCGHTFETETWGVQVCPNCGTRVMLDPPPEEPEVVPGPDAEQTSGEVPPPFEDPSYGFLKGYFETWKQSIFQPTEFFSRLPVHDAGKAFLYAWLTQVVGGEIAMLWTFLQMQAQRGLMANVPGGAPPETAQLFKTMSWVYGGAGFILIPLFAVLGIFLSAGIIHLGAMIAGAANRGWNATFRAVCYASGPQLFAVIPICGGLVGGIWVLVLDIIGLMHTQRTTGGRATIAVLVLPLLLVCLCGILMAVVIGAGSAFLQHARY